jgi:hypothetical protein
MIDIFDAFERESLLMALYAMDMRMQSLYFSEEEAWVKPYWYTSCSLREEEKAPVIIRIFQIALCAIE